MFVQNECVPDQTDCVYIVFPISNPLFINQRELSTSLNVNMAEAIKLNQLQHFCRPDRAQLTFKALGKFVADDNLIYIFFYFSGKCIDISGESFAWQTIHMKRQRQFL